MESIEPVWLYGAIALVCGVFLGFLINRKMNPSAGEVDELKAELERERAETERYKESVNSHFNKTSELVNELTQDYVKVYRHLAEGAQALSDTREFTQVLDQPQGRVLISVDESSDPEQGADAVTPVDETAGANDADRQDSDESSETGEVSGEAAMEDIAEAKAEAMAESADVADEVAQDQGDADQAAVEDDGQPNRAADDAGDVPGPAKDYDATADSSESDDSDSERKDGSAVDETETAEIAENADGDEAKAAESADTGTEPAKKA